MVERIKKYIKNGLATLAVVGALVGARTCYDFFGATPEPNDPSKID